MSRDTPVDWTQLTDPEQALRWSLRGEDDYDSYQKDNQFVARVIFADDVHSEVSASELLAVFGTMVSSEEAKNAKKFRGRIIGKNSPHSFLPDPCNPDFQGEENEELTKNLINLHTLFYIMNAPDSTPAVNSYWLVTLNASGCPGAPFNLQFAQANEILSEAEELGIAAEEACESLADLEWEEGSPLGTATSRASGPPNADGSNLYNWDDSVCDEGYDEFWLMHPLNSPTGISSPFGAKRGKGTHGGVDFASPNATATYAGADGILTWRGKPERCGLKLPPSRACGKNGTNNGGLFVEIDHGVVNGKHYKTQSMHHDRIADGMKKGMKVKRGEQIITYTGMTGNTSGAHAHFQLVVDGKKVNPVPYIKRFEKCPSPEKLAAIEAHFKRVEETCITNGGTYSQEEKKCVIGEADA